MATAYVGVRPVLRGRMASEFRNPSKAKPVGTYSHYVNFAPGLLTGMPDNHHVPGTGYHPHGIAMTRRHRGLDTKNPLDAPGLGARISGMRFRPLENKAAGNNLAFPVGFGHAKRSTAYSVYNNFSFDGVTSAQQFVNTGHAKRVIGTSGTAASFGAWTPDKYKGVTTQALANPINTNPVYGHQNVNEWKGVASAKAL